MDIRAIAEVLGVHPNTVRFHLNFLTSDGRVERVAADHNRAGRPPLLFRAVQQMDRGGPRQYRLLAEVLTMGIAAGKTPLAKALAVGRNWGQRLGARTANKPGVEESIESLTGLLDELGFAPERRDVAAEKRLGLRHCPFLELAEVQKPVVCHIHLGLMQGALQSWAAPVSIDRLDAFVEPDLCVAHLKLEEAAT
jgi:predicted ArsR family transcriptional regulator